MRPVHVIILGVCLSGLIGCDGEGGILGQLASGALGGSSCADGSCDDEQAASTPTKHPKSEDEEAATDPADSSDADTGAGTDESAEPPPEDSEPNEPETPTPPEPLPGDPNAGASMFKFNCQHCHGANGAGGEKDIRGASAAQVTAAVIGANQHEEFPGLMQSDIDNLVSFLATVAD